MPSVSNKQRNLMAACAHGANYGACPPLKVAREFNRADQHAGLSRGGSTSLERGLEMKMNFGQGHGHNFFSTTPLVGHALSGSLGKADHSTRHAQKRFARFAEGGEVKKPAGPSAKERKQIRDMIERGKSDAIETLRTTRSALLSTVPSEPGDIGASLDELRGRLAMKDGGAIDMDMGSDSPELMYEQYMQLLDKLHDPQLDENTQMQIVDRLAQLESGLEAIGIDVGEDAGAPPG